MSWNRAGIERAGMGWAGMGCLPYHKSRIINPASSPVAAASLCRRTHDLQAWDGQAWDGQA